jgi:hypothetical protein
MLYDVIMDNEKVGPTTTYDRSGTPLAAPETLAEIAGENPILTTSAVAESLPVLRGRRVDGVIDKHAPDHCVDAHYQPLKGATEMKRPNYAKNVFKIKKIVTRHHVDIADHPEDICLLFSTLLHHTRLEKNAQTPSTYPHLISFHDSEVTTKTPETTLTHAHLLAAVCLVHSRLR